MATWDLDAARKERLRQRDPIRFTLGGETFECLPIIPLGVTWALADELDLDALARQEYTDVLRGLAEMIADLLVAADVDRWWALFQSKEELIDGQSLFDLVSGLTEEYAGRPTSPSTGSFDGRHPSGDTSSSMLSEKASELSES